MVIAIGVISNCVYYRDENIFNRVPFLYTLGKQPPNDAYEIRQCLICTSLHTSDANEATQVRQCLICIPWEKPTLLEGTTALHLGVKQFWGTPFVLPRAHPNAVSELEISTSPHIDAWEGRQCLRSTNGRRGQRRGSLRGSLIKN